jgi:hypothetical protein
VPLVRGRALACIAGLLKADDGEAAHHSVIDFFLKKFFLLLLVL